jgi:16S rRNA (adenine1518-N6/adenine1519-N6)-dimethyltransferase
VPLARRPRLGQHFLATEGYRQRIVRALALRPDDLVVEIGPGRGAMTELLAERARRVVGIELDAKLATELREKHGENSNIEIVQADILATDLDALCRRHHSMRCFVFGNLPYYITSPILHHLMNAASVIRGMALLVQREVAERLIAKPGSRHYGYLTVVVQLHSEPRMVLKVPPGAFRPPPKIHSALVEFVMRPKYPDWSEAQRAPFLEFIKACFAQKRKSLVNNLGSTYGRERVLTALERLRLPAPARAEELSVEQFVELSKLLR